MGLERLDRARSLSNLRVALRDIVHEYNVEHAGYWGVPPLAEGDTQAWVPVSTLPEAWLRHYAAADYVRIDPVVRAARQAIGPVDWRDLPPADAAGRRIAAEAREFGIPRQGLSFPIRGSGGDFGVFSVMADVADAAWDALKQGRLLDWLTLAQAIHRRVLDIGAAQMRGGLGKLSPRERDILQLIAHGLTSDEVSAELGISERVVRGYLQGCRNKLNARNSTHAVARAVKLGLVSAN